MPIKLHPFDPAINKPRPNADGSVSTEITRTVQLPNGAWANVPSLWWGDGSQVRDFGSMGDDQLAGFASRYEADSGTQFPRYSSLWAAEGSARTRSEAGGGTQGKITGAKPMPNGFNQMGSIPEGYDSLLNAARQQLVRMPDGSLQLAPQFGGSTSLDAIYGGILPSAPPSVPGPLKTRSVPTYNVDNTGAPIVAQAPGFSAPSMGATRLEQSGSRPALTAGTQPAGTVTMPPGARPAVVDQMMAQVSRPPTTQPGMFGRGQPSIWDPFGTQVAKDTTRLPANDGGEAGFLSTFYPDAAPSSAVTAINNAAPVPMPRVRPIPPAMTPLTALTGGLSPTGQTLPGATNFDGSPVQIMVRGGNQLPKVPLPRARPNAPAPQSYTIQSGDTLGSLAKRFGTTVNQLANANGIANPNKIRAGATLNLGFMAPPVPRMPPAALGRGYAQPTRPRETFDSVWAEARG